MAGPMQSGRPVFMHWREEQRSLLSGRISAAKVAAGSGRRFGGTMADSTEDTRPSAAVGPWAAMLSPRGFAVIRTAGFE